MTEVPFILGIESSCDDTSAAVVHGNQLLSSVVSSQLIHEGYGGVVPELASRAHQQLIVPVVDRALRDAGVAKTDLRAIAVTYGPGLAGSLLVGLSFAKALAFGLDVPLLGINHLDGHIYSVFIREPFPPFPFLSLVVSGGHTQLLVVEEGFRHTLLGQTRDDAAGEAFDKVAKLMDAGYPGGPSIDRRAARGNPKFVRFPRTRPGPFTFSFSGIKTSVLYYLNRYDEAARRALLEEHIDDLCASFQAAVVDMLLDGLRQALRETGLRHVAISGGVSANSELRRRAAELMAQQGAHLYVVPPEYCTDNAAMIAVAGRFKLAAGHSSPLTLTAVPNASDI